ncbi:hypothetical protein FRC15_008293 [Serendipita sp. 397]|nr:hypothetical protein FRC15_008293 [Serendipita sp. 397]
MVLPQIKGNHAVGTSYWKSSLPRRVFGSATLKGTQKPAFVLEEVAFQIFYPCEDKQAVKAAPFGIGWIDSPLAKWADGYSSFLGYSRWLLYPLILLTSIMVKVPAFSGPPLKPPPSEGKRWPLVFFSHGLAGTRTTYSQLCSKLAAEGHIVIAMEHRDGTSPACTYPVDGESSSHYYLKPEALDWQEGVKSQQNPMPLRTQQLEMRHVEILEAFKAFKSVIGGDKTTISNHNDYRYWDSWKNQVDVESMTFVGHSFGGCTGIHLLSHATPEGFEALPISKAIIHDPWFEPLSADFEENAIQNGNFLSIPVLVINSGTFTLWRDHFAREEALFGAWVQRAKGSIFTTLVGSKHMAFSDFPVLLPWSKQAILFHHDMHDLSNAFIEDKVGEFLLSKGDRIRKELIVDNPEDDKRKRIRADVGDFVVHFSSVDLVDFGSSSTSDNGAAPI